MSVTVVTALYRGQDVPQHSRHIFDPSWADKLYRGINRFCDDFEFVCLVDDDYDFKEDIRAVPFENDFRNMFCLLEALRGDYGGGHRLFMGLDTIITGDIDHIAEFRPDFAMIRDPYFPRRASGVMSFSVEKGQEIYEKFQADVNKNRFQMMNCVSDMIWLDGNVPVAETAILQDEFPNQILSYKVDIRDQNGPTADARIVYFHGDPKPHQLPDGDPWRAHWV